MSGPTYWGRWSAPPAIRRLIQIPPLVSSAEDEFEWPSHDGLCCNKKRGQFWVPEQCSGLTTRICIIAHTGPGGHRGQKATDTVIRRHYFWSSLKVDVKPLSVNAFTASPPQAATKSLALLGHLIMVLVQTTLFNSTTSKWVTAQPVSSTCSWYEMIFHLTVGCFHFKMLTPKTQLVLFWNGRRHSPFPKA